MQFSMKFAVLAFLAQVAIISASPPADHSQLDDSLVARATTKLPKQQLCGAPCALKGLHGSAWQRCVEDCIRSNHPSPPPTSPQRQPQPQPLLQQKKPTKPRAKGKRASIKRPTSKRPTTKRPTQQECEVTCTLMGLRGAAWQRCVEDCVRSNYPSPPPSPPQPHPQPLPQQKKPRIKGKRTMTEFPTQIHCPGGCKFTTERLGDDGTVLKQTQVIRPQPFPQQKELKVKGRPNQASGHTTRPQHQQQPLPHQKRPGVKPGKARSYEEDEE
ncbi:hypothetical protein ONZ45_g4666 [Pleurotus djamor]|nr:hypothetical protein ONZ45_g4666 [Pleurotus djamor]